MLDSLFDDIILNNIIPHTHHDVCRFNTLSKRYRSLCTRLDSISLFAKDRDPPTQIRKLNITYYASKMPHLKRIYIRAKCISIHNLLKSLTNNETIREHSRRHIKIFIEFKGKLTHAIDYELSHTRIWIRSMSTTTLAACFDTLDYGIYPIGLRLKEYGARCGVKRITFITNDVVQESLTLWMYMCITQSMLNDLIRRNHFKTTINCTCVKCNRDQTYEWIRSLDNEIDELKAMEWINTDSPINVKYKSLIVKSTTN